MVNSKAVCLGALTQIGHLTDGRVILKSVNRIIALFPASCLLRRFDIARYAFNVLEINLLGTKAILRRTPMTDLGLMSFEKKAVTLESLPSDGVMNAEAERNHILSSCRYQMTAIAKLSAFPPLATATEARSTTRGRTATIGRAR